MKAAPKDALSSLHKDTQEGAFEVALLKLHLSLHLRVHLKLHLSCASIALVAALIN